MTGRDLDAPRIQVSGKEILDPTHAVDRMATTPDRAPAADVVTEASAAGTGAARTA